MSPSQRRAAVVSAFLLAVTGCSKSEDASSSALGVAAPSEAVADAPSEYAAPSPADGLARGKGGPGSGGMGGGGIANEAQPALSANARYATTYRPGRGHVAAFDAAVSHGLLPPVYKDLVGDFAGRYVGDLPAPTEKALSVSFAGERSAVPAEGDTLGIRISLRGHELAPVRAPLAVFLVLDTSGSMAGAAISNAKKAAAAVVKKLQDADTFAMVTFSSDAKLLVGAGPVGTRRGEILGRIAEVEATGGTNLSAGLDLAYGEARHAQSEAGGAEAVSVALLLSDGQATAGETNPQALAARSSNAFQDGIQTSAFGVGDQFDAPLLSTVADRGAGGYYFLADSAQIAKALTTELDARLRPVATGVELRVRLGDGVVPTKVYGSRQLSQLESSAVRAQEVAVDRQEAVKHDIAQNRQEDSQSGMRFFLPAFAAADEHATLLEVRVPKGPAGERQVATLEVRYKDRKSGKNEMFELPLLVKQGVPGTADKSVQSAIMAYAAGADLLRAAELAQSGRTEGAAQLLAEQQKSLDAAAIRLGIPALHEDAARLGRLAGIVAKPNEKPMALAVLLRGSGYGYLQ